MTSTGKSWRSRGIKDIPAIDAEPWHPPPPEEVRNWLRRPLEYSDRRNVILRRKGKASKVLCPIDAEDYHVSRIDLDPEDRCPQIKKNGQQCGMIAGHGTDHPGMGHCAAHGGASKGYEKKAVLAMVESRRVKGFYGDPDTIDPDEALLQEVHRTAGHVEWLRELIQLHAEAKDDARKYKVLIQYTDVGQTPSALLEIYMKERQHLVRVCKAAIDAGIAARRVEVAENQARIMAVVMMNFIQDAELGLDYVQQLNAKKIIRKHLEQADDIKLPALPSQREAEAILIEDATDDDVELFD